MIDLLRIMARTDNLPPQTDRVHLANGTYILGGRFVPGKEEVVRSRFPVAYRPDAPRPQAWLRFLDELLEPEDVICLQEFIGYGLIPSNKGQRMMIIKGKGGEGKSQIGTVLARRQCEERQRGQGIGKPLCPGGFGTHSPDDRR